MSTTTVKTDTTAHSKVLPGDKSGLPWEIWQMILSYLSAHELCQACRVNKTWNELVTSLDSTRWKELYLTCIDWRHPYWPLAVTCDPPSWKKAYMDQYLSVHYWTQILSENKHTSCLYVFKRNKERKIIKVGPGLEHESLKSALAVANSYDRIEIYPGIYDEQFEMSSKIPFELVGHGELGSVILVVSIEQVAITARLNNLVFRAPWFTTFILKVRSGYLQIDNCILEDGMIYIQHPGTCHISFCTFRHATVILQHVNVSIIENCEFSQSDIASIIVEGYSKEEKNWTFPHMCEKMNAVLERISSCDERRSSHITMKTMESQSSMIQSVTSSVIPLINQSSQGSGPHKHGQACCGNCTDNYASGVDQTRSMENRYVMQCSQEKDHNGGENATGDHPKDRDQEGLPQNGLMQYHWDDSYNGGGGGDAIGRGVSHQDGVSHEDKPQPVLNDHAVPPVDADRHSVQSPVFDSDDDDSLSLLDDFGSGRSSSVGSHGVSSSASDSDSDSVENVLQTDSDEFSSSEDSVIMLPHLRMQHVHASISANSVDADVMSVCSQTKPLSISLSLENLLVTAFDQIQGCLVNKCRMLHSKGGVMVSLQAHAMVCECDISNVDYGIRCIQNARMVILKNKIHHCQTSGIFMRLAASGLIGGNDIYSNMEAGIDIRKNADPIVQSNRIHHGKRSGIVVLGSGRGQIKKNDIFQNREAGVYVLYGGNPTISDNHIYDGRAAGLAINEGGRGSVFGNVIEGNQWGGIDIRHGGNPLVCGNSVCDGGGDGIVIGEHGQGSVENNIISGNAGCGVWIMSASQPYLQGNQISGNRDSGILFVNKMDVQHVPNISDNSIMTTSRSLLSDADAVHHHKCRCATVQYNNIYHNAGNGVVIQLGDEVHVSYNAIHANHCDGVSVDQVAEVVLQGNSITNNRGSGVVTSPTGKVTLKGNGIYHNEKLGIVGRCDVTICGNDVISNHEGGISLEGCVNAEVSDNRIQCGNKSAVIAVDVREGSVQNNKLFLEGRLDCMQYDHLSKAIFKHNHIVQPKHSENETGHEDKVTFCKTKFLDSPAPRPVIEPPPAPSEIQLHNTSTVKRVMAPSRQMCEQGSKFCVIL